MYENVLHLGVSVKSLRKHAYSPPLFIPCKRHWISKPLNGFLRIIIIFLKKSNLAYEIIIVIKFFGKIIIKYSKDTHPTRQDSNLGTIGDSENTL